MISGGERQRVAIARAIASGGEIILADEPTENLDSRAEKVIVELLCKLAHEDNYAVIVVTHKSSCGSGCGLWHVGRSTLGGSEVRTTSQTRRRVGNPVMMWAKCSILAICGRKDEKSLTNCIGVDFFAFFITIMSVT